MVKYKIKLVDKEGDILESEIEDGTVTIKEGSQFTFPNITSAKIKRLMDGIDGTSFLLEDFEFKEINIEKED